MKRIKIQLLLLSLLFSVAAGAQQFQPLWLIEWAPGQQNGYFPLTGNFNGQDGVQKYAQFDTAVYNIIDTTAAYTWLKPELEAGNAVLINVAPGGILGLQNASSINYISQTLVNIFDITSGYTTSSLLDSDEVRLTTTANGATALKSASLIGVGMDSLHTGNYNININQDTTGTIDYVLTRTGSEIELAPLPSSPTELNGIYTYTNKDSISGPNYTVLAEDGFNFVNHTFPSGQPIEFRIGDTTDSTPQNYNLQVYGYGKIQEDRGGVVTAPLFLVREDQTEWPDTLATLAHFTQPTFPASDSLFQSISIGKSQSASARFGYGETNNTLKAGGELNYGFLGMANNLDAPIYEEFNLSVLWDKNQNVTLFGNDRTLPDTLNHGVRGVLKVNPAISLPDTTSGGVMQSGSILYHNDGNLWFMDSLYRSVNVTGPEYAFVNIIGGTGTINNDTVRVNNSTSGTISSSTTNGFSVDANGVITYNGGYNAPIEINVSTAMDFGSGSTTIRMFVYKNGASVSSWEKRIRTSTSYSDYGINIIDPDASDSDTYEIRVGSGAYISSIDSVDATITAKIIK